MISGGKIKTLKLFDLTHTAAGDYLGRFDYPWQALEGLSEFILNLGATLGGDYYSPSEGVWVHKSATVAPTACINAPAIVGEGTEIRHCAFIRGSALIGKNCVVGNSTEVKNSILFDGVQAPHYNYVGDSVLGYKSHLGAGAITSNVKSDKTTVFVAAEERFDTGLIKAGAFVGDFAEVGCNSVLNPGTVIGRNSSVYPLSSVRGVVPENSIYKNKNEIVLKV